MEANSTPILETARLVLRPLRLDDAARIQELFPHWGIVRFMATVIPWPYPDAGAREYLEATLPKSVGGRQYDWALTRKAAGDDRLIGAISLYPASDTDSRGFWLAEAFQNQGLMTEAVCAVNDFAFDGLGLPRLLLNNAAPNRASHRLKEASGAKIIGVDADGAFIGGSFPRVRWLLTHADWAQHRASFLPPKVTERSPAPNSGGVRRDNERDQQGREDAH